MNNSIQFIIVGAGLTGSIIARYAADRGYRVKLVDRRNHIAGNLYDYIDDHGILVQKYGTHAFHTKKKEILEFIKQYEKWKPYNLKCGAVIDGRLSPTPFNLATIDLFYDKDKAEILKAKLLDRYEGAESVPVTDLIKCEDSDIREYAEFLFEKDYAPYTAKQWGITPEEIDPSVLRRVPVRLSYEDRYFDDEYQVMPTNSYMDFFENLLDNENIEIELEMDALEHINVTEKKAGWDGNHDVIIVYTGAIDELFGLRYGKLPYRSLRFEHRWSGEESFQDIPLIAYPQEAGYTRITEFRKLTGQQCKGTSYAYEFPISYRKDGIMEPYYPVLTDDSKSRHEQYRRLADEIDNLICCGRLADFRYFNMDEAIDNALNVCRKFFEGEEKKDV